MSILKRSCAKALVPQVRPICWGPLIIFLLDCSVLEAVVKQTPIGDKYFINEVLKEPKTVNVSQVIMVRQYL